MTTKHNLCTIYYNLSTIFRPAERVLDLPETVDVETPGTFQVKPSINQPVTQFDSTVLTPAVTLTCNPVRSPKHKVTQRKLKVIKENLYDEVCMRGYILYHTAASFGDSRVFY